MAYVTRLKTDEELLINGISVVSVHPRSRGVSHLYLQIDAPDDVTITKQRVPEKPPLVDDS